jgi:hypothetical protein
MGSLCNEKKLLAGVVVWAAEIAFAKEAGG